MNEKREGCIYYEFDLELKRQREFCSLHGSLERLAVGFCPFRCDDYLEKIEQRILIK